MSAIEPTDVIRAAQPGFHAKVARAAAAVSLALSQARRPYVAYSGGKDSMVVLDLVHRIDDSVPLIWSDDELEYDETVEMMRRLKEIAGKQMIVTLGHARHAGWFDPWMDYPYWREPLEGTLTIGMPVEQWAADKHYDVTFTGLRMDESKMRRSHLILNGPIYRWSRGTRCCPLWEWTADDVWAYIASRDLPYCAVYDRLTEISIHRARQRVGPLPLTPRDHLAEGWPTQLMLLEARYGPRWVR